MNKDNISINIARDTGLTQKDVLRVIDAFIAQMKKVHLDHAKVELRGFGTFFCTFRKARGYVDARFGKTHTMKERWNFRFRASKTFLDKI